MNGAGNDFILLNDLDGRIPESAFPTLAKTVCERHLSIGADGLMIEVHNDPAKALCDGAQSLTPAQFAELSEKISVLRKAVTE